MNFIRLLPVLLSILLLGAHFLRAGNVALVLITLAIPLVLLIRRPWAAHMVQIELIVGGAEWVRTLISLVLVRQAMGAPWTRLALIPGGVAMLPICSAFVFRSTSLRERYYLGPASRPESST